VGRCILQDQRKRIIRNSQKSHYSEV
jgi:hypothetical protein